jgi:phosphoribosyl 1,2-cyclic phosphodiesterase
VRLAALGSGSRGNGLLVQHAQTCLLVDCGFSLRSTLQRLQVLGHEPQNLSAILVTHEHSDHIKGVPALAVKYRLPVYMTHGTARHRSVAQLERAQLIRAQHDFQIGDIRVQAVTVPHDAREPCQYVFEAAGQRLGLLTDLGHVTPQIQRSYSDCDTLFIESNHDEQMLAAGSYPAALKRRVGGKWGHLSNRQTREFLRHLAVDRLRQLVVGHISEQNNSHELVSRALHLPGLRQTRIALAAQDDILPWIDVGGGVSRPSVHGSPITARA